MFTRKFKNKTKVKSGKFCQRRIKKTINFSNLLTKSKLYVVGVSGGPDSMFLLDNLRKKGYKITVAHVNYKKRSESDHDEELVKRYCQKYSLTFDVCKLEGNNRISINNFQDKARRIRYDFFQTLAKKYKTKCIIIAHHLDDHLETFLFQKKRNSLVNHWGLPLKIKWKENWIIRPILALNKQQIIHYLTQKKIYYATDITNQFPVYQRNIIRQELEKLDFKKRIDLVQEIEKKNKELKKIKELVKEKSKSLIFSSHKLLIEEREEFSQEVWLRLLYFWINQATEGILQKRKKGLLIEIYKRIFFSQKKILAIELRKFKIVKAGNWVTILKT